MAYDKIHTMVGLSAVRDKPGMYVGSTTSDSEKTSPRGLIQIAQEIISNSADEAMNGYGDTVDITLNADNSLTVADHGRGVPRGANYDAVTRAFTVLHSSGKVVAAGDAYDIAGGTHGVGAKATNALSEWLTLDVWRSDEHYKMTFQQENVLSKSVEKNTTDKTGTAVTFLPDEKVFSTTWWDVSQLRSRIDQMSFVTPGVTYTFTNRRDGDEPAEIFCHPNGMADLVARYAENLEYIGPGEPLRMTGEFFFEGTKLVPAATSHSSRITAEVSVAWTDSLGDTTICMTNGIPNPDGGPHREGARRAITRLMNEYGRDSGVLKKSAKLTPEDTRDGIILAVSVGVPEEILQFESQTKEKLGTTQADAAVYNLITEKFTQWLYDNEKQAKALVERMKDSMEARSAAVDMKKAKRGKSKKGKLDGTSKLYPATHPQFDKRELYVVEGDSAGTSTAEARMKEKFKKSLYLIQAVLPLKGKPLNVAKATLARALKNTEIQDILEALDCGFGADYDESKLKYGKLITLADGDDDGAHIVTLLITLVWKMMPEFITNGHMYIAEPPLYRFSRYVKGKRENAFATSIAEYEKMVPQHKGWSVTRLKGLGEMNSSELRETVMDPDTRSLVQVTPGDAEKSSRILQLLMSDDDGSSKSAAARRAWIQENVDFHGSDEDEEGQSLVEAIGNGMESFSNMLDVGRVLEVSMGRYSKASILRAIPDIRDGMIPVRRRSVYSMLNSGLTHKNPHTKMAFMVGETMKLHPHGDSSIFDAAVRMSHQWNNPVTLLDVDGNKGSTNSNTDWAAMRYIEGRLDEKSSLLTESIRENTVEFVPSYDNRTEEPLVLPAQFPVLLTNGDDGRGVGFSTKIPQHSPVELLKAAELLNRKSDSTLSDVMRFVKGPDLPSGCRVMDREGIRQMYKTGQGKFVMQCTTEFEDNDIIITSLPQGTFRASLIKNIIDKVNGSTLSNSVKAVTDESVDGNTIIRIALERKADKQSALNMLLKKTLMRQNFTSNFTAIIDRVPQTFTLVEYLRHFVDFRHEIETSRLRFELDKKVRRVHMINGFLHLKDTTDEVIHTIRESEGTKDDIAAAIMPLGFDKEQAVEIVGTQLYRLAHQDFEVLQSEKDTLTGRINHINHLLSDEDAFREFISEQLKATLEHFKGYKRHQSIEDEVSDLEVNEVALVEDKEVVMVTKPEGVQRMTRTVYDNNVDKWEGDIVDVTDTRTTHAAVMLTSGGRAMQRTVEEIPHSSVVNPVDDLHKTVKDFTYDEDIVAACSFPMDKIDNTGLMILSVTEQGMVKRGLVESSLLSFGTKGYLSRVKPFNGLKLDGDRIAWVKIVPVDQEVSVTLRRSSGGRSTTVNFSEINVQGGSGSGARAMKTKPGETVVVTEIESE